MILLEYYVPTASFYIFSPRLYHLPKYADLSMLFYLILLCTGSPLEHDVIMIVQDWEINNFLNAKSGHFEKQNTPRRYKCGYIQLKPIAGFRTCSKINYAHFV